MATSYYTSFNSLIEAGNFDLTEIIERIRTFELRGDITATESTALQDAARAKAIEQEVFGDFQVQIDLLGTQVRELRYTLDALMEELGIDISVPASSSTISQWSTPTGTYNAYYSGDRVIYEDVTYRCIAPAGTACIWSPAAYPDYWEAVT